MIMKYLRVTIALAAIISTLAFQIQAQRGTPKDSQGQKTSTEKSAPPPPPSEKEKQVKEEKTGKPDATEAVEPAPPSSKEKLATAVALALSIVKQADID